MEADGVTADPVGPRDGVRGAWRSSSAVGSGRALAIALALTLHVGAVVLLLMLSPQRHPPVERTISLIDLNLTPPPPALARPPKEPPPPKPEERALTPERNSTPTHMPAPKPTSPHVPVAKQTPIEQVHRSTPSPTGAPQKTVPSATSGEPHYLPQYQITAVPVMPVTKILSRIQYPPLAARLGIEATVYLELYIDKHGVIRKIVVLKDPGDGFAEAAVAALQGLMVTPAEANGKPVAVRFRYPIRFTLK